MQADEYQAQASRTDIDAPGFIISDRDVMFVWHAIGLAGEAGEVAELVKKGVFHRHGIDREKLQKELGDVLWYVSALCSKAGLKLSDVMALNIEKLRARYPDGWDHARSIARTDT